MFVIIKMFPQMDLSFTQTNRPNFFSMTLPLENSAHVTFFLLASCPLLHFQESRMVGAALDSVHDRVYVEILG